MKTLYVTALAASALGVAAFAVGKGKPAEAPAQIAITQDIIQEDRAFLQSVERGEAGPAAEALASANAAAALPAEAAREVAKGATPPAPQREVERSTTVEQSAPAPTPTAAKQPRTAKTKRESQPQPSAQPERRETTSTRTVKKEARPKVRQAVPMDELEPITDAPAPARHRVVSQPRSSTRAPQPQYVEVRRAEVLRPAPREQEVRRPFRLFDEDDDD